MPLGWVTDQWIDHPGTSLETVVCYESCVPV